MKLLTTLYCCICILISTAQNNCFSQRYLQDVFNGYTLESGIYYGSADPYGLLNNQDLYLDVYMPAGDSLNKRPVILHKFGGGYAIGWRSEPNIPDFAEMYTKRGFVFVSIDYRLGFNPLEAASAERAVYRGIVDLRAALRFLVDSADVYQIDTSNIFLTGTSAGSISAMGQSFMNESDRPNSSYGTFLEPSDLGCTNCPGNNNFNNQEVQIHGIINNWGAVLDTSLIDLTTDPRDSIPVISFHGTNDNAVKYVEGPPFSVPYFPNMQGSFLIHKRLETLNIKNELHPLVGFGHEPQLLNPDITDTIVHYASHFLYEIMQGKELQILGDSTTCLNDTTSYSVNHTAGSNYCWNVIGGDIINYLNNTVVVHWTNTGTHSIQVSEQTAIHVTKSSTLNIEVATPTPISISYTSNDGLFDFSATAVANASYDWFFGDGSNDIGQNVQHQYTDTGIFTIGVNVNNQYCNETNSIQIESDICPNALFDYTTIDSHFIANNNSQFYIDFFWDFGDGNTSTTNNQTHYSQEGLYTVQLIVSNQFCSDTLSQDVEISFCTLADFDYSINNLSASFTNTSYQAQASFWDFGDSTTSGVSNPNHTYSQAGTYTVQLITFNSSLCSDTILKNITIINDTINTAITNQTASAKFKIFPNPISDFIWITQQEDEAFVVEIKNILGEMVLKEFYNSKQQKIKIDFENIETGIYFITIQTAKQSFYYKVLKE